ncbi:MAG: hypothetical protein JW876_02315 [Candidatus Krumholzibacteriota bacterium]|nr:hypothetical protein [Candidatus Krumholzibacteriota bacterium]
MRLSLEKIESLCRHDGTTIGNMLMDAGVSRNAFYTLARKKTVVPRSLVRIASHLGISISDLLEESPTPRERMVSLAAEAASIAREHPGTDLDNVRHTLILLDEKPVERLRRALRRGRSIDFRRA